MADIKLQSQASPVDSKLNFTPESSDFLKAVPEFAKATQAATGILKDYNEEQLKQGYEQAAAGYDESKLPKMSKSYVRGFMEYQGKADAAHLADIANEIKASAPDEPHLWKRLFELSIKNSKEFMGKSAIRAQSDTYKKHFKSGYQQILNGLETDANVVLGKQGHNQNVMNTTVSLAHVVDSFMSPSAPIDSQQNVLNTLDSLTSILGDPKDAQATLLNVATSSIVNMSPEDRDVAIKKLYNLPIGNSGVFGDIYGKSLRQLGDMNDQERIITISKDTSELFTAASKELGDVYTIQGISSIVDTLAPNYPKADKQKAIEKIFDAKKAENDIVHSRAIIEDRNEARAQKARELLQKEKAQTDNLLLAQQKEFRMSANSDRKFAQLNLFHADNLELAKERLGIQKTASIIRNNKAIADAEIALKRLANDEAQLKLNEKRVGLQEQALDLQAQRIADAKAQTEFMNNLRNKNQIIAQSRLELSKKDSDLKVEALNIQVERQKLAELEAEYRRQAGERALDIKEVTAAIAAENLGVRKQEQALRVKLGEAKVFLGAHEAALKYSRLNADIANREAQLQLQRDKLDSSIKIADDKLEVSKQREARYKEYTDAVLELRKKGQEVTEKNVESQMKRRAISAIIDANKNDYKLDATSAEQVKALINDMMVDNPDAASPFSFIWKENRQEEADADAAVNEFSDELLNMPGKDLKEKIANLRNWKKASDEGIKRDEALYKRRGLELMDSLTARVYSNSIKNIDDINKALSSLSEEERIGIGQNKADFREHLVKLVDAEVGKKKDSILSSVIAQSHAIQFLQGLGSKTGDRALDIKRDMAATKLPIDIYTKGTEDFIVTMLNRYTQYGPEAIGLKPEETSTGKAIEVITNKAMADLARRVYFQYGSSKDVMKRELAAQILEETRLK